MSSQDEYSFLRVRRRVRFLGGWVAAVSVMAAFSVLIVVALLFGPRLLRWFVVLHVLLAF